MYALPTVAEPYVHLELERHDITKIIIKVAIKLCEELLVAPPNSASDAVVVGSMTKDMLDAMATTLTVWLMPTSASASVNDESITDGAAIFKLLVTTETEAYKDSWIA